VAPRLCLACCQLLWAVAPQAKLQAWFDAAEATLTASLTTQTQTNGLSSTLTPQARQEQENLLGEVIAFRAILQSYQQDGQRALPLFQQALALLSADNLVVRAHVGHAQLLASYFSSANDAVAAIEHGLQASALAQVAGQTALAILVMGSTVLSMLGAGRLHEAQQLALQATQLGAQLGGLPLPEVSWPAILQVDILREWNQLDAAMDLVGEALSLCQQTESVASLGFLLSGYAVLLRIHLSRGDLDAARLALQQYEQIRIGMNQPTSIHIHSLFTTIDQVRLWLACRELDRATDWAEELDVGKQNSNSFAHEREEVARTRIHLAKKQPHLAQRRLEPVLQRATAGQRWGHVIEIRLLQALAHQMLHEVPQALSALSEAIRLAEPESFPNCENSSTKPGQLPTWTHCLPHFQSRTKRRNVHRSGRGEKDAYEHINPCPESASGYQILYPRCTGEAHLAPSPQCLARQGPYPSLHPGLSSRGLRKNHLTFHLGTISASPRLSTLLDLSG